MQQNHQVTFFVSSSDHWNCSTTKQRKRLLCHVKLQKQKCETHFLSAWIILDRADAAAKADQSHQTLERLIHRSAPTV